MITALLSFTAPAVARTVTNIQDPVSGAMLRVVADEVTVGFHPGKSEAQRAAAAQSVGGTLDPTNRRCGLHRITLSSGANVFATAATLRTHPDVASAFPNVLGSFESIPTDPGLVNWWFDDKPLAGELAAYWNEYQADNRVTIVLMDTGIDFDHLDLKERIFISTHPSGNIIPWPSFLGNPEEDIDPPAPEFDEDSSPRDFAGHGTSMAGLITAERDNGIGIAGLAANHPVWVFKVGSNLGGEPSLELLDLLDGLDFLSEQVSLGGSDKRYVVNLSLGYRLEELTPGGDDTRLQLLHNRVSALDATGQVMLVAASGNDFAALASYDPLLGCDTEKQADLRVKYPAAFSGDAMFPNYSSVLAVGAYRTAHICSGDPDCACICEDTNEADIGPAEFSRYKPPHPGIQPECTPIVDLLAPGGKKYEVISQVDGSCASGNIYGLELSEETDRSKTGWGIGTSCAAAITSCVVATIWSLDINLAPSEIKMGLKASAGKFGSNIVDNASEGTLDFVDYDFCIDPPEPCDPPPCQAHVFVTPDPPVGVFDMSLKAGAGMLRPGYALLTLLGSSVTYVTAGYLDQDRSISTPQVVLEGAVEVPNDVTLTLGVSPSETQIISVVRTDPPSELLVDGVVTFQGPVEFRSFELNPAHGDWGGLRVGSSGSISSPYAIGIKHGTQALYSESTSPSSLSSLAVEECLTGPIYHQTGDVTLSECTLRDIPGHGLWVRYGGDLHLGSTTVEEVTGNAILVQDGTLVLTGDLTIVGSSGITVSNAPAGSIINNVSITGSQSTAISYDGGDWTFGPDILVDGSGAQTPGVYISGPGTIDNTGPIRIENAGFHGLSIVDAPSAERWEGLVCRFNGGDGLHVDGPSMRLGSGCDISSNGGSGVWLDGASLSVLGATVEYNASTGIYMVGQDLEVLSSVVRGNLNGVIVDSVTDGNLGAIAGANDFSGSTNKFVVNLRPGTTVLARGNYWGGSCPPGPKATKFIGAVDYANCIPTP